jgi:uncharacterized protein YbjT (DUF2867 family)
MRLTAPRLRLRVPPGDWCVFLVNKSGSPRHLFVTGGTGFMGRRLVAEVLARGHTVRALVRRGSESKLPAGATPVIGDALDRATYVACVRPADTFVHLVGVGHPNPAKAEQFRRVDGRSAIEAIAAAAESSVAHFVYVSVAQPAPVMRAYIETRAECERALQSSGLSATILRPWYVLGPGRRWPLALKPMYWLLERIPSTRESSKRLGLLTIAEMVAVLVAAVEEPATGVHILGVPEIRQIAARVRR